MTNRHTRGRGLLAILLTLTLLLGMSPATFAEGDADAPTVDTIETQADVQVTMPTEPAQEPEPAPEPEPVTEPVEAMPTNGRPDFAETYEEEKDHETEA